MLKEAEEEVEQLPTQITEDEAFIECLRGIDRSAPTLRFVPPPPAQQRKLGTIREIAKPSTQRN